MTEPIELFALLVAAFAGGAINAVSGGGTLLTVPAAFTLHTGKDHWHVLLRGRAIESQCYVIAAAQYGHHYGARQGVPPLPDDSRCGRLGRSESGSLVRRGAWRPTPARRPAEWSRSFCLPHRSRPCRDRNSRSDLYRPRYDESPRRRRYLAPRRRRAVHKQCQP